jgi:hypothetical protein
MPLGGKLWRRLMPGDKRSKLGGMYTITLTAVGAGTRGRAKHASQVCQPEAPWVVRSYGRPTPDNLGRFVREWEKRQGRQEALKVTRAVILRRRTRPEGIVAVYGS